MECCAVFSERTFNEIDPESRESVAVGDHNFRDASSFDGVQNGEETPPLEVEARGDVDDDLVVVRAGEPERFDLAQEVAGVALLTGRDASVENDEPDASVFDLFRAPKAKTGTKVPDVIPMGGSVSISEPHASDRARFRPLGQGGSRHAILFAGLAGWNVGVVQFDGSK